MEVECEDGNKLAISKGKSSAQFLGRAATGDRTVSRRHLFLQIAPSPHTGADPSLSFEVKGKNPVLVIHGGDGGERKLIFRPSERGELRDGDRVSLSLRSPRFYRVKDVRRGVREAVRRREEITSRRKREEEEKEEEEKWRRKREEETRLRDEVGEADLRFDALVASESELDPIKDFGFLVRGHEFDKFPKQKIFPIRDWNWFLDDPRRSDDEDDLDDEAGKRKKIKRAKKGKVEDIDEVWTCESEDDNVSVAKVEGAKKCTYSTRSHDQKMPDEDANSIGKWKEKVVQGVEEDEEDKTLGGFIVNDDDQEIEEGDDEEEEEEEEEEEDEEEFDEDEGQCDG